MHRNLCAVCVYIYAAFTCPLCDDEAVPHLDKEERLHCWPSSAVGHSKLKEETVWRQLPTGRIVLYSVLQSIAGNMTFHQRGEVCPVSL